MALLTAIGGNLIKNLVGKTVGVTEVKTLSSAFGSQQSRSINFWTDWRMLKDYNKRQEVVKGGAERIRINAIRKNDILPREIRELADEEVKLLPRNSSYLRIVDRCVVTSRPKGCVRRWRVSRIVFRHLADYNKLAGVQRGLW